MILCVYVCVYLARPADDGRVMRWSHVVEIRPVHLTLPHPLTHLSFSVLHPEKEKKKKERIIPPCL